MTCSQTSIMQFLPVFRAVYVSPLINYLLPCYLAALLLCSTSKGRKRLVSIHINRLRLWTYSILLVSFKIFRGRCGLSPVKGYQLYLVSNLLTSPHGPPPPISHKQNKLSFNSFSLCATFDTLDYTFLKMFWVSTLFWLFSSPSHVPLFLFAKHLSQFFP